MPGLHIGDCPPVLHDGVAYSIIRGYMNIRFLETFLWVARLRSFKATAGKLNLTQAAISGRIAALEEEVGQQLFDRGMRDLPLTPAGRALLFYAEQMLELESNMRRTLRGPEELRGLARIGIVESVVHTWFAPFIKRLQETHPGLEIELTTESTRRLHDLLRRGVVDVLLQTDPLIERDVRNRDLGALQQGWICSTEADIPERLSLAELVEHPLVTFPRHSQPHLQLLDLLMHQGVQASRIHFVSSIFACVQLIRTNQSIATLPIATVRDQIAAGKLRVVRCDVQMPALKLVATWRPDPVASLSEAVVTLAMDEMHRYASAWPDDTTPPLDSGVLVI